MPVTWPAASAGDPDPRKRKPPIPKKIRDVITLMIYGQPDDEDCTPIGFIEAAKECGVKPDVMRRYLDRGDVRAYLLAERRAFRAAVCGGNELALQRVRDRSPNAMAVVASVRALEQLESEEHAQPSGGMAAGVVIRLISAPAAAVLPAPTIDVTPTAPKHDEPSEPIFEPRRAW